MPLSTNLHLRNVIILLKKWSKQEYTIAAFTIILFIFSLTFLNRSNQSHSNDSHINLIPFTPLANFKQLGARASFLPSFLPSFLYTRMIHIIFINFFLFSLLGWHCSWLSFPKGFWIRIS